MKVHLEREMTITPAEFMRTLKIAFADEIASCNSDGAELDVNGGHVRLQLSPRPARTIGALRLPVTRVAVAFTGLNRSGRQYFLERFDRSFQRGGG